MYLHFLEFFFFFLIGLISNYQRKTSLNYKILLIIKNTVLRSMGKKILYFFFIIYISIQLIKENKRQKYNKRSNFQNRSINSWNLCVKTLLVAASIATNAGIDPVWTPLNIHYNNINTSYNNNINKIIILIKIIIIITTG